MFCPACGEDAGDDERCPSCEADLSQFRNAAAARGSGKPGGGARTPKVTAGKGRSPASGSNKGATSAAPAPRSAARRWLPWIVAAVVVVAAIAIVVARPGGGDSGTPAAQDGGAAGAPVADTSGTYEQLVQRANGLYDKGGAQFQAGDAVAAASYFSAAAEVYGAAWEKQPGDPNVGTDWATSLFYSGEIDGAIARVDKVLAANPEFQPGYYNRGNYLEHRARALDEEGDSAGAAQARKEAEAAFRKAVQIDPKSDVGKAAEERLKSVSGP